MIREAYIAGQEAALEKVALNAKKSRELASKFGLIPEGQWKWALRNLRKGKAPEQLGMAPKKLRDAILRLGGQNEASALWGKGTKGVMGKVNVGGELSGDIDRLTSKFLKDKKIIKALTNTMEGKNPLKNEGIISNRSLKILGDNVKRNTIHSHPSFPKNLQKYEKDLLHFARNPDKGHLDRLQGYMKNVPRGDRYLKRAKDGYKSMAESLGRRYDSSYPVLMPSGYSIRSPYNPKGSDVQRFMIADVGTHHNIISPGVGVGIHTVRPDKATGGKRLRTILFKDKT